VVRILTPGTQIDPDQLDSQSYRYLCAVCQFSDAYGLAACDLSSGRFETTEMLSSQAEVQLFDELSRLKPVEYLVNERFAKNTKFLNLVQQQEVIYTVLADDIFGLEEARQKGLTFSDSEMLWPRASAALLTYLENTQKKVPGQIGTIQPYALRDYMLLDRSTRSNLEITETIRDRKRRGSLLWAVDRTQTAMGARLLRSWLEQPLIDPGRILRRQSSVASLLGQFVSRQALRDALAGLYDIVGLEGSAGTPAGPSFPLGGF